MTASQEHALEIMRRNLVAALDQAEDAVAVSAEAVLLRMDDAREFFDAYEAVVKRAAGIEERS